MKPAARVGDATTHGAPLSPGPGSTNVLIGNRPAWRAAIDQHACPAVTPSGADGVGCVVVGSPTVLINNQMACRVGDVVIEKPGAALGPTNPIIVGEPTVLIGEGGIASQIAVTVAALRNAAKSGVPLIQICPECKLLAALSGFLRGVWEGLWQYDKPGKRVAASVGVYDAIRGLLKSNIPQFKGWKGAGMGFLKTILNNLGDLKQGKYAAFVAKVGYGALRGWAGEAVGAVAATKGGAAIGGVFPPIGGALGGSAIGKAIGGLLGGKKGAKVGAIVGGILGAAVGAIPGVGHAAGIILGAIGAKMWASELAELGLDQITGGEETAGKLVEKAAQFFNRSP